MRNPKDTYCSYYSFFDTFYWLKATFEEAAEYFCEGKMPFGCYFDHCLEFWKRRQESNILILKYEDMLSSSRKSIKEIAEFLDKEITEEQIEQIFKHTTFDSMKRNPKVNLEDVNKSLNKGDSTKEDYIREGKSGNWKKRMSPEISEMFDKWIAENSKGTDLIFDYD